jgi:hypothetical protein
MAGMRRLAHTLLVAGACLSGCSWGAPSSFRYKITVEVETPSGIRTGEAVREVRFYSRADRGGYGTAERGEAVAVDVAPGQTLFALISGDGEDFYAAFPKAREERNEGDQSGAVEIWPDWPDRGYFRIDEYGRKLPNKTGARFKPPVPRLVRFTDVLDPKSVEEVQPNDLAASFGSPMRLKRIAVEVCRWCAVTSSVGNRLTWLGKHPEPSLDPNHAASDTSLAARLHHGNFRQ